MIQEPWEVLLEDALATASPEEVLSILRKIKGWTAGYCITCGQYNDTCGGKMGCKCAVKGEWDE